MTLDYSTTVSEIKSYLVKYVKKISNDDYLAMTRLLDGVEDEISERIKFLSECREESKMCAKAYAILKMETDRNENVKLVLYDGKLSFMERLRFLFNKEK